MLRVENTKMKACGRNAIEAQVVMTSIANVDTTTKHNYSRAFLVPLKTLSTQFKYNY